VGIEKENAFKENIFQFGREVRAHGSQFGREVRAHGSQFGREVKSIERTDREAGHMGAKF